MTKNTYHNSFLAYLTLRLEIGRDHALFLFALMQYGEKKIKYTLEDCFKDTALPMDLQYKIVKDLVESGIIIYTNREKDNARMFDINSDKVDDIIEKGSLFQEKNNIKFKLENKLDNILANAESIIQEGGGLNKMILDKKELESESNNLLILFKKHNPFDAINIQAFSYKPYKTKVKEFIKFYGYGNVMNMAEYAIEQSKNISDQYRITISNVLDFINKYNKILAKKSRDDVKIKETEKQSKIISC